MDIKKSVTPFVVVGQTWREGTGFIQTKGTPRPAMTWLMNFPGR